MQVHFSVVGVHLLCVKASVYVGAKRWLVRICRFNSNSSLQHILVHFSRASELVRLVREAQRAAPHGKEPLEIMLWNDTQWGG